MGDSESGHAPQIGVTVSRDRDRELLGDLFDDAHVREVTGTVPADIDLCVVDETTLQTDPERFAAWRQQQSPVFAPLVVLAEDSPATTRAEYAEQSPLRCDSIIEVPLPEAELRARLANLLERRRLSRELADEKQLTASIFDSSPLAKLVLGPDGTIERANTRAGELFDVPEAELVGRLYNTDGWILLAEGEKQVIENGFPFMEVFETESSVSDHECSITREGSDDILLSVNAVPIRDESDAVAHVLLTIKDITERKTREDELQQMRNAVDKAPIGIVVTDPTREDNPITYVNDGFVAETGYTREEALGRNCRFLQGEDTDETTVAELRRAIDAEEPASVTIRNYRADGSAFWNHLEIAPVRDASGAVVNYIGFQQDVTERKEREEELRETRQRLELVLSETNTGVWTYEPASNMITPIKLPDNLGLADEAGDVEAYLEQIHPADREAVKAGIATAIESGDPFDIEFRLADDNYERWLRSHGTVVADADGADRVVGITTEVTERVHRKRALEKRERLLRELHTATRKYYPLESKHAVANFVIEFLDSALDLTYASMKLFDEDEGILRPICNSTDYEEVPTEFDTVAPGSNPVWEAYRNAESAVVDAAQFDATEACETATLSQLVAVPVGDFGVLVVYLTDETAFSDVDIDILEVVTTNAEAVIRGLESAESQSELAAQLSTQRTQVDTLRDVVDTIQELQDQVSQAETRSQLDTAVCEELVAPDTIDFVWIGRPQATETTLTVTASAGGGEQYLDTVRSGQYKDSLPARMAATSREVYANDSISTAVREADWAKEALSCGYNSVLSVPLVHDGVLYGVLTAYSMRENAFDETYADLLTDSGSLLLNYTRILSQRSAGSSQTSTTVTFEFDDESCLLQQLAANTRSEIRLKTVARATDDTVTVVVEITDGDREVVAEYATTATGIRSATPFGTDESQQLLLEFPKPFIVTDIENHGGQLLTAHTTPEGSRMQIEIRSELSRRPLFEFITGRLENAELLAQEEGATSAASEESAVAALTDRQREILTAAYYGGYYETPREITGEELAAGFDISSPAVYNHLQAAHRKLLDHVLEGEQANQRVTLDN
ncbi:MAG: PAS domain S-box protein [Halonotius sp.]